MCDINYFIRYLRCDIGFRVQFNAEIPRQVMNFPMKFEAGFAVFSRQE